MSGSCLACRPNGWRIKQNNAIKSHAPPRRLSTPFYYLIFFVVVLLLNDAEALHVFKEEVKNRKEIRRGGARAFFASSLKMKQP